MKTFSPFFVAGFGAFALLPIWLNAQTVSDTVVPKVNTPQPIATPATPTPSPTVTPMPSPMSQTSPVSGNGGVSAPTPLSSPIAPQTNVNSAGKGSTTIGKTYAPTNAEGKVVPRNP